MPRLVYETFVPVPAERVWEFHSSAKALESLTPPGQNVRVEGDAKVADGVLHVLHVKKMRLPLVWKARISEVTPPTGFTDTAEKSPFRSWRHRHDFLPVEGGTLLRDTIDFEMPFGPLGAIALPLVRRDLDAMFAHRHRVTVEALT